VLSKLRYPYSFSTVGGKTVYGKGAFLTVDERGRGRGSGSGSGRAGVEG
jgi:hypothetical protein